MSTLDLPTLETWVSDFVAAYGPVQGEIRVVVQDGDDGADTGLVQVRMRNASTVTTVEPAGPGSSTWMVTFEARDEAVRLGAAEAMRLARELATVSELCAFLEARSRDARL